MRPVAKVDIRGAVLSFEKTVRRVRLDVRRRNDGDVGERSNNRDSRGQGIVVEVVCKGRVLAVRCERQRILREVARECPS